jgi:ETC complex I subunit-like protein
MSEVRILSPRPARASEAGIDLCASAAWLSIGAGLAMAQARIYQPAKTAMQSGRARTRKWVLEYLPATARRPDPLMGWASAADTLNEVQLRFDTLDEARAFAEKLGLDCTVSTPHHPVEKPKSYADNFRWDRVRT